VLYTDRRDLEAPGWEVRVVNHGIATLRGAPSITAPMLAHKWWKCRPDLALPDCDASIWLDASMEITVPDFAARNVAALGVDDWSLVRHPTRAHVLTEADFSATLTWRYDAVSITAQRDHYRAIGFPDDRGLMATGHCVRRHTAAVVELGHRWWDECVNWSHQDQLSLPVLMWLYNDRIRFNWNLPWFQWWHLHEHGGVT
jgi:hypothetical protein